MITFYSISALVNFLTCLFFALFVIYKKREKLNFAFFWFSISAALWSFGYLFWQISSNEIDAIFWCKILTIGSILIPIFYFRLTLLFLELEKNDLNKIILFSSYLVGLFLILISFSSLLVSGAVKKLNFRFWPNAGSLYWILLLLFFSLVSYSIYLLIKYYLKKTGSIKEQIKFLLLGTGLGFLGGTTNFPLWYDIKILPVGNILSSLYVFLTAYAIIAHRLMDIKLVMRRYSVYLFSLISILLAAVGIKYVFDRYLPQYSDWIDLVILMGSISVYPAIRNYFYRVANKYFFSSLYDSGEVIASLSEKLRSTLEAEKIYGYIFDTLSNAFHAKAVGILTYNEKTKKYIINYNNGFNTGGQQEFDEDKKLNEIYIKRNRTIITDDIKTQFKNNKTLSLLLKLGVEILTPLNVKDKTIGLIALGAKESGDMYNEEDLKVLEVVGAQTAIALENALLYKETKNFSVKMEKEVEKATHDLRKANIQLKKLDAAKSEFISIASHQLRTPLTVIKGYISMMLEGNFGALTKPETESLEKVFLSNERLIQLVENLLNISRIESGRLQFDYKEIDLNKMAESVMEELSGNAKKKNLILQYKPPVKPLALLKIDEEKIRQVVMNLIDNGIKYTKQGSVTVKLEQIKNKVKFCVSDSGMGIRPEDMVNLFKKFSRGTGTSLIHTEGTGLGLYVARMMIEAHQGRIWAESDGEGKGSRFCFELPIK